MRVAKVLLLAIPLSIVLALSACSSGDGGSDGATESGGAAGSSDAVAELTPVAESEFEDMTGKAEVTITAKDNSFSPQYVIVSPGTKVTFDNRGRNPHNVIPVEEGAFEKVPTEDLQPGDTATLVFDDPGLYPYYCSLHATPDKGMTGRIRVADQ